MQANKEALDLNFIDEDTVNCVIEAVMKIAVDKDVPEGLRALAMQSTTAILAELRRSVDKHYETLAYED